MKNKSAALFPLKLLQAGRAVSTFASNNFFVFMKIVIQQERKAAIAEIQRDEAALREAVSRLHNIEELTIPTSLEDIAKVSWVREQLNGRIALVRSDKSLTAAEREQRILSWKSLKIKAERAITKVSEIVKRWPGLSWVADEDGKNFHLGQPQIEQAAMERATREVPAAAEEHWRLITQMREAVEALRNFEAEHQVKDAPLIVLSRFDEDRLYREWITGNILIAHRVIAGRDVTARKIKELFY